MACYSRLLKKMPSWLHTPPGAKGMTDEQRNEFIRAQREKEKFKEKVEGRILEFSRKILSKKANFNWIENPIKTWDAPRQIYRFCLEEESISYDLEKIINLLLSFLGDNQIKEAAFRFLSGSPDAYIVKHPYREDFCKKHALAVWREDFLFLCNREVVLFPYEWEITTEITQTQFETDVEDCFSRWVLENLQAIA